MYIEAIRFKREKDSEWESGYYVGKYENCKESVFLDSNYQPLTRDENGCNVWDYRSNLDNWIKLRIPENYKEEEK